MKVWIKQYLREELREELREASIKPKELFGMGSYHQVYQSKKNPDRLYKIGDKETIDEWVNIFQKHPKFFPKIYRVFKLNSKENPNAYVVEIEKLQTRQATMDLSLIDEYLIYECGDIKCGKFGPNINNFFEEKCFNQIINKLNESDNTHNLVLKSIFIKWAKFLREVYPIIKKEFISTGGDGTRELDLHVGNVAYDKNNNIKLIDI